MRLMAVVLVILWLSVACATNARLTPTSEPRTFVTFKQAYVTAQQAALSWDAAAIVIRPSAPSHVYTQPEGTAIVLLQDGTSAVWYFEAMTPTRITHLTVSNGANVHVGMAEKGEMICVGNELVSRDIATLRAQEQGAALCDEILPADWLKTQELDLANIIDSDRAVAVALQQGLSDWRLDKMSLDANTWKLIYRLPYKQRILTIDAQTGQIVSDTESQLDGP